MTDRPSELEQLLHPLRAIEVPPGARERVRRAIDERLKNRPGVHRRRLWTVVAVAATASLAAVVVWRARPAAQPGVARVLAAANARGAGGEIRPGQRLGHGRIRIRPDGSARIALGSAQIHARGSSSFVVSKERVVLDEGSVTLSGRLEVGGLGCRALLDGRAEVSVRESRLYFTVVAGSVQVVAPEHCLITYVEAAPSLGGEAPRARAGEHSAQPVPTPQALRRSRGKKPLEPGAEPRVPVTSSELAEQTTAYRAALSADSHDDAAALERWRRIKARWPGGPLEHEVDFRIVDALVRLGRRDEAQAAARDFLRRHPQSPRRVEMRAVAGAEPMAPQPEPR